MTSGMFLREEKSKGPFSFIGFSCVVYFQVVSQNTGFTVIPAGVSILASDAEVVGTDAIFVTDFYMENPTGNTMAGSYPQTLTIRTTRSRRCSTAKASPMVSCEGLSARHQRASLAGVG